ncbi:hypothetical protein JW921_07695 [Candidatus Fermentibacterales bacterium]|nr:hypothetical protein [Candidatus Fermentibacterales bacterium]
MKVTRSPGPRHWSRLPPILLLLLSAPGSADWIVWDYDLRSCPPGWEFDPQWEFSSEGVRMNEYVSTPYMTEWGDIFTGGVEIPSGCDSIVLHTGSYLTVHSSGNGFAGARVHYRVNQGDWVELFGEGIWYESAEPLHLRVPTVPCGLLEFHIEGYAGKGNDMYPGWGSIDWLLHDLTLVFYGESVGLEGSTWGGAKVRSAG